MNPRLHYNDSITIIPHGCNGLATFAGCSLSPSLPSSLPPSLPPSDRPAPPVSFLYFTHSSIMSCGMQIVCTRRKDTSRHKHDVAIAYCRLHVDINCCYMICYMSPTQRTFSIPHPPTHPPTHPPYPISSRSFLGHIAELSTRDHGWRFSRILYQPLPIFLIASGVWCRAVSTRSRATSRK